MKEIIVTTQKEFDDLPEKFDEYTKIIIKNDPLVGQIVINKNCGNSSVVAWVNSLVMACGNSSVVAHDNSSVMAWGNSSVEANGNSSVVARGNSSVVACGNSSVVAHDNSSVMAWGNSSVEANGNSSVKANGNSSVMAWGNSSVMAWGNSSVMAWGNVGVHCDSKSSTITLFMFSVCWAVEKGKITKKSSTANIIECLVKEGVAGWLDSQGIEESKLSNRVILYKRVSSEFKTQENTDNETLWKIGTTLTHPNYNPSQSECGSGKYHACSRPYFCDEFRNEKGDKYIAISIFINDLYAWKNPQFPHKISFIRGTVLYECDHFGNRLTPKIPSEDKSVISETSSCDGKLVEIDGRKYQLKLV